MLIEEQTSTKGKTRREEAMQQHQDHIDIGLGPITQLLLL